MIWTEKYRPKKFSELIGQDVEQLKNMIKNPAELPHILLVSRSPGTGKTSTAYVIKEELGVTNADFLILNSSDERKLEHIRGRVKDFARTARRNKKVPKIILMDEADGMLKPSQEALRTIMEIYSSNVRFILTANDEQSIIDPIKSRCTIFRLKELPKDKILTRLLTIIDKENIIFEEDAVIKIIDMYYPDMRSMLNELQRLSLSGKITLDKIEEVNVMEDRFFELLKIESAYNCRKYVIENGLDPVNLLKRTLENIINMDLSKYIKTQDDAVKLKNKINELLLFGAEINYRMVVGADKEIQMYGFILKYQEVFG